MDQDLDLEVEKDEDFNADDGEKMGLTTGSNYSWFLLFQTLITHTTA